jgi:hypothetical protein
MQSEAITESEFDVPNGGGKLRVGFDVAEPRGLNVGVATTMDDAA